MTFESKGRIVRTGRISRLPEKASRPRAGMAVVVVASRPVSEYDISSRLVCGANTQLVAARSVYYAFAR